MKQKTKLLALILATALTVGSAPALAVQPNNSTLVPLVRKYDGRFSDMQDIWCADAAKTCFSAKLMEGRQANRFDAASPLTDAQILVICARLHDLLTGGNGTLPAPENGTPWYQPAYDRLVSLVNQQSSSQASMLSNLKRMASQPDNVCTRQTFSDLLLLVLDSADISLPVLNDLTQATPDLLPDCSTYSLYRWGILNGTDAYGTYGAWDRLNRGQAAAILARVVDPAQRLHFTLQTFDQCRDVLSLPSMTVLLTIDGRAYTAEDCAEALCQGMRREMDRMMVDGEQELPRALDYTVETMKMVTALEALANQLDITVTDEEVVKTYGPVYDGYKGRPAAVSRRIQRLTLLHNKLVMHYENLYGTELEGFSPGSSSAGESRFESALESLCDAMAVIESDAFQSFDLSAAVSRLKKAPAVIGSNYDRNL